MGDISEVRILVTIFSFIGVFVLLIGFMPSGFLITAYEGKTVTPPEDWESGEMLFFAESRNETIVHASGNNWYIYDLSIGGHNLNLYDGVDINLYYTDDMRMVHFWYWWIFATNHHYMNWVNSKGFDYGEALTPVELDDNFNSNDNMRFNLKDEHVNFWGFFSWNITDYDLPSEAWEGDELNLMVAIEFDQVNTSVNAWSLISMLLFFGLPSVSPIINAIIAIPIWIAIAYVSYILILRAIGAVFGGGGA